MKRIEKINILTNNGIKTYPLDTDRELDWLMSDLVCKQAMLYHADRLMVCYLNNRV